MTALVPFATQAPQLSVWSTPSFSARNPSAVWATYVPRLLFNTTLLARFRANWVNSYWSRFATKFAGQTTALAYAMTYLATGTATNVTAAYNAAIAETYGITNGTPESFLIDSGAWVLDWCWPALTPTQRTNLINKLESNANQRKLALPSNFQLHESQNQGFHAWLFGSLAIQAEAGTTDRAAQMKFAVQNYQWMLSEDSSGLWTTYTYQLGYVLIIQPVWELASGQDIATLTGWPSFLSVFWEDALRNMTPDLAHQYTSGIGDQEKRDAGGYQTFAVQGWHLAMAGGYLNLPLARWLAAACTGNGANWMLPTVANEGAYSSWTAMIFFDPAASQTPVSTLPLCKGYTTQIGVPGGGNMDANWVAFRDGWNLTTGSTDIIAQLYGAMNFCSHAEPGPGHLTVQRGMDELLTSANTYCGSPSNIQTKWSLNSFHNNCANLTPTGSSTPDLDGSAICPTAVNSTTLPASYNISYNKAGSQPASTVTKFQESAVEHYAAVSCGGAYPVAMGLTYNRYVSFIPAHKLIIVRDTISARSNAGRTRFNWWGRVLPVSSGGVATITKGSSKITIQCMDPFATLTLLGGTGSEQIIDGVSWPVNTANCQAGKPVSNLAAAIAGQGRATFEVPITSTDVVHALTIDDSGNTAPTYTLAQLKSFAPLMFGAGTMPGFTQFAQKDTLDHEFSVTRYLALFTTVPADDGTGGVEVSGGSYARKAILTSDWNAASGGGPALKTNLNSMAFVTATGSWGTIAGWGWFDASTSGNLRGADYLGSFTWNPFTCSSATPGVITSPAHGYSNGDSVVVTTKYGGALPSTAGSWAGVLTVANVTTDTFTAGVNTTSTGDGLVRKVATQAVGNTQIFTFASGVISVSLG